MRVRSTTTGGFNTTNTRTVKQRSSCTAAWSDLTPTVTQTGVQTVKTITDTVTPNFFSLCRKGKFLPLNTVEIVTTREERIPGSGDRNYQTITSGTGSPCFPKRIDSGPSWGLRPWLVTLPPPDDDIIDAVVTNAIADAKESVFDLGTFLGELREAHAMMRSNMDGVFLFSKQAAREARRSTWRPGEAGRLFSAFNSRFLELQFGWLPLLRNYQDAKNALNNTMSKGFMVDGSSKVEEPLELEEYSETPNYSSQGLLKELHSLNGTRTYRGKAFAEITFPDRYKWGLDPLVAGWELIRFSFIVDYFINVGNWVQAITPFGGASLLGSCGSIKESYTQEQSIEIDFSANADTTGNYSGRKTILTVDRYHRFPHSGGILPSWNPRLTTIRLVNLASLAYAHRRDIYRILFD